MIMRYLRDERGLTLTELVVALALVMMVGAVFLPVLYSSMEATGDLAGASTTTDQARLVLQRIDREFRAAERICTPTPGNADDYLEFETRAYTSNTTASNLRRIAYQLNGTTLEKTDDGGITWSTVITGVVNGTVVDDDYNLNIANPARPAGTADVPLFTISGGVAKSYPSYGKVATVRVWVDPDPNDSIGPKLVTTELAGRNIWAPNDAGCFP